VLLSHFFIFLTNSPSSSFGPIHVAHHEQSCKHCGRSCLVEMKLSLHCVEEVAAETFRFSKGASVLAHGMGCGYYGEGYE
jgi:hypothetical protein